MLAPTGHSIEVSNLDLSNGRSLTLKIFSVYGFSNYYLNSFKIGNPINGEITICYGNQPWWILRKHAQ